MKKREFNKQLSRISTMTGKGRGRRRLLDPAKIAAAGEDVLHRLACHVVSRRGPVVKDFVTHGKVDRSWLACCGYMHEVEGERFRFICTAENAHLVQRPRRAEPDIVPHKERAIAA